MRTSLPLVVLALASSQATLAVQAEAAGVTAHGSTTARTPEERAADLVNVLDFGAKGDGVADDTGAIQAAIASAKGGTVFLPRGVYRHTGLTITTPVRLEGSGWDFSGTVLQNTSLTRPAISITSKLGYMTGATLTNLLLRGNKETPGSNSPGVYVRNEGNLLLDRVYVYGTAGAGLFLEGHTSCVSVRDSRFQHNRGDAIYGRTESRKQINAINILSTELVQNEGHAINLWGTQVNIRDSIVQGNGGAGVFLNADDMNTRQASAAQYEIVGNYFEQNRGGAITGRTNRSPDGETNHSAWFIHIEGNYLMQTVAGSAEGVTAAIRLSGPLGSYRGLRIGSNTFSVDGKLGWVDFDNSHDSSSFLTPVNGDGRSFSAVYKNTGGAITIVGDRTMVGVGAPAGSAEYTGQRYRDRTNNLWYVAISTGNGQFDWSLASMRVRRVSMTGGSTLNIDAALGSEFIATISDANAFAVSAPNSGVVGQRITLRVRNESGSALGSVTWSKVYKLSLWVQPTPGHSRAIDFQYDGLNWIEVSRTPGDVPN